MMRVFSEHIEFSHDERILRPDGSVRYLHTWGHPGLDASGRLVRLLGVCQDITDRKLAEQRLEKTMDQLRTTAAENARLAVAAQKAVQLRDDFLSIASHELRTPLTPLAVELELLRDLMDPSMLAARPALDRLIESSRKQVARLARLVEDLLDVSRLSRGRLTLSLEEVDLASLVEDVVERLSVELQRAGCVVEVIVKPGVVGHWDRLRIEQIVFNLLTNAIKYGAGKPIAIRVASAGGSALLSVRDLGIGIAPADQARVFERFERAVSVRIRVVSTLGEGATFIVEVPLQPAVSAVAPSGAVPADDRAGQEAAP
jgi:signal transduction histidine kinase